MTKTEKKRIERLQAMFPHREVKIERKVYVGRAIWWCWAYDPEHKAMAICGFGDTLPEAMRAIRNDWNECKHPRLEVEK